MDEAVKVAELDNQFEAQILGEILRQQAIPFLLKSYYDSAYDGLFQGQKGWGAVYAAEEQGEEVRMLLAAIRQQNPE
jgi:hypothetical protein